VRQVMATILELALVIALILYLFYALLRPEKF
jgi:K+-transporting ATPase KdpF subunit